MRQVYRFLVRVPRDFSLDRSGLRDKCAAWSEDAKLTVEDTKSEGDQLWVRLETATAADWGTLKRHFFAALPVVDVQSPTLIAPHHIRTDWD